MDDEQELSFRDLFELIRRGFLWALLAGIVVAAQSVGAKLVHAVNNGPDVFGRFLRMAQGRVHVNDVMTGFVAVCILPY